MQQSALQAGVEAQKPDTESAARIRATGKEYLHALDEEIRKNEQDAKQYQDAIDKVTMALARQQEQALTTLQRMAAGYTQTKEARDADTAASLQAQFSGNEEISQAAEKVIALAKTRDAYNQEVTALRERFTALKQNADALRQAEQVEGDYLQKLRDTLEQLRAPRDERLDVRLRQQGATKVTSEEGREEEERLLAQIRAQENLNKAAQLFEQFGNSVASAWTQGLTSIADGTKSVSEAFRDMARSILQSLAQIAAQEGFKALISLGVRAIAGAATSGAVNSGGFAAGETGGFGSGGDLATVFAQSGAVIRRPTMVLAGEDAASSPEYILNRGHMQELLSSAMKAGPSAGGQAAGVHVTTIVVPDKAQAEQLRSQEEAIGHIAVVHVLKEMSAGEGSRIVRTMRTVQR
jgi:hypothetical protein